jgi:hypothetical protein
MNALLALVAILLAALALRALARALPVTPRARTRDAGDELATRDLERLERTVANASAHAGELHLRLRPILCEVAAAGLRRRGVDLEAEPTRARELLAPETWELVRLERPRPVDPFAPGLPRAHLDAVLDDLEGLLG